jgi:hypothetical protein
MDKRQTFGTVEELMTLLSTLYLQKAQCSWLLDREGLTRAEGCIVSIELTTPVASSKVFLEGNSSFLLEQVIAVNGIFKWDYSEC